MQPLSALIELTAPLASAWLIVRLIGPWPKRTTALLAGSVVYMCLEIAIVHLCEVLRLCHILKSLSLRSAAFVQIFTLVFICVLSVRSWRKSHAPAVWTTMPLPPFGRGVPIAYWIVVAIVGSCWAAFAVNALSSYPQGGDGVGYHLPVAVRWLQDRSLTMPASHTWAYCLPGNAEIGMMLLLATGWQSGVFLYSLIAAAIGIAATFSLAYRFSANHQGAALATLMLSTVPIIQYQAFDCYIDLFGAGFILAGLALFLSRHERPDRLTDSQWYLIAITLAGCSCGIAIGTKPTYYVYGGIFLVGVVLTLLYERKGRGEGRATAALLALLIASVLIPSGFWYLRALLETGNPLYPLRVEVAGTTLFDGLAPSQITPPNYDLNFVRFRSEWLTYPWTEYKRVGYNYGLESGLGAAWATFVPLGMLYTAVGLFRTRRSWATAERMALMTGFVILVVLWWIGLRRMPRFGIPLIALSCVLAAPMFALLQRSESAVFRWLLVASCATSCVVSAYNPLHELLGRVRLKRWDRPFVYGYPKQIDALPEGTRLLLFRRLEGPHSPLMLADDTFFNYFAVAGSRLTNRVIHREWLGDPLSQQCLKAAKIDYVFESCLSPIEPLQITGVRICAEGRPKAPMMMYHWRIYAVSIECERAVSSSVRRD